MTEYSEAYLIKHCSTFTSPDNDIVVTFYKIGFGDALKRLKQLQIGNPVKLELAHSINIPKNLAEKTEYELHKCFTTYTAKKLLQEIANPSKRQEWFGFTNKLLHKCIYYMNRMAKEIEQGGWNYFDVCKTERALRISSLLHGQIWKMAMDEVDRIKTLCDECHK